MAQTREEALKRAQIDLAQRLGISEDQIQGSGENAEFPDAALGAPVEGEMSAQMITPGWRFSLCARGQSYEYRADKRQLRLYNYQGSNYRV